MGRNGSEKPSVIEARLVPAFEVLLEASDCSRDSSGNDWDYAVEIQVLRRLGLSRNDLRWLVRKGYVEHAREVTRLEDDGREFRPTGNLTFVRRTCFVLTEVGVSKARSVAETPETRSNAVPINVTGNGQAGSNPLPRWDAEARTLWMTGQLVKRFKWPAENQETLLNVFHEDGWPERIDDPLPPRPGQESKRRLSDTIKCLNNKQVNELIRFHGDGTGEGVTWERFKSNGQTDPAD